MLGSILETSIEDRQRIVWGLLLGSVTPIASICSFFGGLGLGVRVQGLWFTARNLRSLQDLR